MEFFSFLFELSCTSRFHLLQGRSAAAKEQIQSKKVIDMGSKKCEIQFCCRDRAQEVSKEEIVKLNRSIKRGEVDLDYLKAVLLTGFKSGELTNMLPVIARLMHFSPEEIAAAKMSPRKSTKPPRR